jgi:hypothetical protein
MKYIVNTNDLDVREFKTNYTKRILLYGLVTMLVGCNIYLFGRKESIKVIYKKWTAIDTVSVDLPIDELAWTNYLVEQGCVLPNICIAQAKVESGFCKSNVAKKAHNPFGITYHKCNYVDGKHGVYANYKTWKDAIRCYIHIQDNYLKNINGKYATDPNYVQAIKNVK